MSRIHIIKLAVGCHSVADLHDWHTRLAFKHEGARASWVKTRYMPKRAEEMIASGGSIYRVINNFVCCRQPIIGFQMVEDLHTGTKCQIIVSPEIILTQSMPRKAFQGWRYLKDEDAPPDIGRYEQGVALPPAEMQQELQKLGLI